MCFARRRARNLPQRFYFRVQEGASALRAPGAVPGEPLLLDQRVVERAVQQQMAVARHPDRGSGTQDLLCGPPSNGNEFRLDR